MTTLVEWRPFSELDLMEWRMRGPLLAIFARAVTFGARLLGGSTRRLFSLQVNLNG